MSNMQAANRIPNIPDHIRVMAFAEALPEWIKTIRSTYVEATGENPWEGQP